MDNLKVMPWEKAGSYNIDNSLTEGTKEYFQQVFPMLYDKLEDYQVLVDYYNEHPEIHPKKYNNEIDYVLQNFKKVDSIDTIYEEINENK